MVSQQHSSRVERTEGIHFRLVSQCSKQSLQMFARFEKTVTFGKDSPRGADTKRMSSQRRIDLTHNGPSSDRKQTTANARVLRSLRFKNNLVWKRKRPCGLVYLHETCVKPLLRIYLCPRPRLCAEGYFVKLGFQCLGSG